MRKIFIILILIPFLTLAQISEEVPEIPSLEGDASSSYYPTTTSEALPSSSEISGTSSEISTTTTPSLDELFISVPEGFFTILGGSGWTYEQLFNDLNLGELNGQDSWTAQAECVVQNSVVYEGSKAVVNDKSGTGCSRDIGFVSDGLFYWAGRQNLNNDWGLDFRLRDSVGNIRAWIQFASTGYIRTRNAGNYVNLWPYNANQWYLIATEFNANQHRYNLYNGVEWLGFSTWFDTPEAGGDVSNIWFVNQRDTTIFYFDTITPTDPTAQPPPVPLFQQIFDDYFFSVIVLFGLSVSYLMAFLIFLIVFYGIYYLLRK